MLKAGDIAGETKPPLPSGHLYSLRRGSWKTNGYIIDQVMISAVKKNEIE